MKLTKQKLEGWGYRKVLFLYDPPVWQTEGQLDGQTDEQTERR